MKSRSEKARIMKNLKNQIYRLKASIKAVKYSESISYSRALNTLMENMSDPAKLVTRIQAQETQKKKKGRRYTMDEKILCLSMYKKSPKSYKLLSRLLTLPSRKSLKQLMSKIKLHAGINDVIFAELKKTVSTMPVENRLVTLIFDEMTITPYLQFNTYVDEIEGFADNGVDKSNKISDHALVFMIKGVQVNYKQPVAYYFTQKMKSISLKETIKNVIDCVQKTGLVVIATVCDQSTVNVSAVNSLIEDSKAKYLRDGKEWRKDVFEVNSKEIIPLFDVPHLIKGLRNNIIDKDLKYKDVNGMERILKWEYFKQVYEADISRGELRFLHKITKEHIDIKFMKKMKVKTATQLLSHSMAVTTDCLVGRGDVPKECEDIIPFVLKIDQLFDSLNASTYHIPDGKIYKGPVRRNSSHHKLWQECIKMLKSCTFVKGSINKSVPTLRNFVRTIEGFQEIWKILNIKYGLNSMLTRNFNQDPIENFFGNVRSLGFRNVSPDCVSFKGAYKTLLLNNFTSTHSVNANCEEDKNSCLQGYRFFIENKSFSGPKSQHIMLNIPLAEISDVDNDDEKGVLQRNYVAGFVLSKTLQKIVKECENCRNSLCGDPKSNENEFIRHKEYDHHKTNLVYPSVELSKCFNEIQKTTIGYLKSQPNEPNLMHNIKDLALIFTSFNFINCNIHKTQVTHFIIFSVIKIIIHSWCRSVNRILQGKIDYEGDDFIKKEALAYFTKHKK